MLGEVAASPFGARLRQWRTHRGVSQLALATKVGSTPRHVSFLETGRSRPSRQMVLRLGEALGVPLRERNLLLHAAGLAGVYPEADVRGPDLTPYRAAVDGLLRAHLPYPAMVLDGRWNVLLANQACAHLYGADPTGVNIARQMLTDPAARQLIVNWPEVAAAGLDRLRRQRGHAPFDAELAALVDLAETALAGLPRGQAASSEPIVYPWFRVGERVVKTVGMVARFEPTTDVTLDELRVELMYPADAEADDYFRALA